MRKIKDNWIAWALALLPFLLGGYFCWTAALASGVFLAVLLCRLRRAKTLVVGKDMGFFAMIALPLCLLLTVLWAQDRGMALPGFFQFLPAGVFALAVRQEEPARKDAAMEVIPWSGAVMTALCVPLSYLPVMDGHLLVNGRQAGLFEYPNTYALFLLLGLVVLATRNSHRWYHGVLAVVLLAGIFLSGSRAVFLLLVAVTVLLAVCIRQKTVRILAAAAIPSAVAAVAVYAIVTGHTGSIGRFLTASIHSSTLLGRLLYARDALPVILCHPFGLGYGSYAYMQGSFQTGVYAVQSVHNDLLQLLLDAGWLPAVLMVVAVVKALFRKENTLRRRMMLGVICAHALFDFSLQYLSILVIFALLLDGGEQKKIAIRQKSRRFLTAACSVVLAAAVYFGAASLFQYLGHHDVAVKLYGGYTASLVAQMSAEEDLTAADAYAQRVLRLDPYVAPAYRIRAAKAYSAGNFQMMIDQQRRAIACAPYDLTVYTDYLDMLSIGVRLYENAGDSTSADYCREEIRQVLTWIQETLDKTSPLGWQIDDKPELTLPEEYEAVIAAARRGDGGE